LAATTIFDSIIACPIRRETPYI